MFLQSRLLLFIEHLGLLQSRHQRSPPEMMCRGRLGLAILEAGRHSLGPAASADIRFPFMLGNSCFNQGADFQGAPHNGDVLAQGGHDGILRVILKGSRHVAWCAGRVEFDGLLPVVAPLVVWVPVARECLVEHSPPHCNRSGSNQKVGGDSRTCAPWGNPCKLRCLGTFSVSNRWR